MEALENIFESHFGRKAAVLSRAPGRLEILGNHTDYNEGYVLSAAVTQSTSFAMAVCYLCNVLVQTVCGQRVVPLL